MKTYQQTIKALAQGEKIWIFRITYWCYTYDSMSVDYENKKLALKKARQMQASFVEGERYTIAKIYLK